MSHQVPRHPVLLTVSVMLATIMQALDTTIANVALPHMRGTMSATQDQISWVLTSYIVAAAIVMPMTGFLAARWGRRRLFLISVVGFTITSMMCGAATTLTQIVLFRLLQGIFGAALVPLSQAVLLDANPPEKHGSAMALWGIGVMVGPILGPSLGGYLTEYYNWRWVFYINLPFGILAYLGILFAVPETERQPDRRFDIFGFVLLGIGIGALQMMLDRGESQDWFTHVEIIIEAVMTVLFLYLFVVHTLTAKKPFIEPGMFADRNFSVGLVLIFIVGIILLSTMALLPPFLEDLLGYPVVLTGNVMAPRGIGTMVGMMAAGRLMRTIDVRYLIGTGLILTAISLYGMSLFNADIVSFHIISTGIVQGLGLGLIFVPLSTITFATLSPHYRTEGTALFSLLRNIGSSIGISLVTTYLAQQVQRHHAHLAEHITPYNPLLASYGDLTNVTTASTLDQYVNQQAALLAYLDDFRAMMLVSLAALPLLLLLKKADRRKAPVEIAAE